MPERCLLFALRTDFWHALSFLTNVLPIPGACPLMRYLLGVGLRGRFLRNILDRSSTVYSSFQEAMSPGVLWRIITRYSKFCLPLEQFVSQFFVQLNFGNHGVLFRSTIKREAS